MKKIIALILFVSALTILIGLGSWQIQRMDWKQGIIDQLEAVYATDPHSKLYSYADLVIENKDLPILYGSVRGIFDYEREILFGPRPYEGGIGYAVITPLTFKNGGTILVHRGYINVDDKEKIVTTHQAGQHKVWGLIREPDWNRFTPNNSPENNVWSKLDISEIATVQNISEVAPYILYAEGASPEFENLTSQTEKWMPRSKHKQYALFWFAMAFALSGVFGLFAYKAKLVK